MITISRFRASVQHKKEMPDLKNVSSLASRYRKMYRKMESRQHALRHTVGFPWILPRPKNMPLACFLNGLSNPAIPGKMPSQSDSEGIDCGRWIMGFGTNSFRGKNCKEPIPSSRNRAICHWHIAVNSSNPISTNKKKGYQTVSFLFMGWIMGFEPTTFRATI